MDYFLEEHLEGIQKEELLGSGFELFLYEGYQKANLNRIAERLGVPVDAVRETYESKEQYYLDAYRFRLQKSCDRMHERRRGVLTERRAYDRFRELLIQMQTEAFISSLRAFYRLANEEQKKLFWKYTDAYADEVLRHFGKVSSAQNRKLLIYCLANVFSQSAWNLHSDTSELICGCGDAECEILVRVVQSMNVSARPQKRTCRSIFLESSGNSK